MLGENLDDHLQMKDICVKMAIYGQMQDDYLDTFGDPNVVGQTRSDIENSTCLWLIAKALELANDEQTNLPNHLLHTVTGYLASQTERNENDTKNERTQANSLARSCST